MNINKICLNTNFGVHLTDSAKKMMKDGGATDFELDTLPCKMPTDAVIDIDKTNGNAYIKGYYATLRLEKPGLTMEDVENLCEAYNIKKYFSVDSAADARKYF
ncbi:MAG: hypothetical protein K6A44_05500 [bacterium]|nr:hypothetical protein [bacterium]